MYSILSKRFRCSNESNQKAIRDRSSKVDIHTWLYRSLSTRSLSRYILEVTFVCTRPDLAPLVPSAQTPLHLRHLYHQVVDFSHAALPPGWMSSHRIWTSVMSVVAAALHRHGSLWVPERRCFALCRQARALLFEAVKNRRLVDSDLLRRFTGPAISFLPAVPMDRFHLRENLQVL
jgi:hypothetical protein